MNCTVFELEVQHLLDERCTELPPPLAGHLADCAGCRDFWQAQQRCWRRPNLGRRFAPAGLVESILAALSRPEVAAPTLTMVVSTKSGSTKVSRGTTWATFCSTAALLLLLAVSMVSLAPPVDPHIPMVNNSPATPSETIPVSQRLASLWNGVHAEYQEFSQETTRVIDGLADLPDSAKLPPLLPTAESPAQVPSSSWLRLDRPVSERVERAFDFLWDALPGEAAQSS